MKTQINLFILFFASIISVNAQIHNPVLWDFDIEYLDSNEAIIIATAKIEKGWHIYSPNIEAGGPTPTTLRIDKSKGILLKGEVEIKSPLIESFDPLFDMQIAYFDNEAILKQKITIANPDKKIAGYVEYMACNDGNCLPATEVSFAFNESISQPSDAEKSLDSDIVEGESADSNKQSLLAILIAGFIGGFAALLMPCIFPMLPLTVSYFTKNGGNKGKAISKALIYGASIILIYVSLGLGITILFGSDALNALSTNGVFNFFFFFLLVIFAASFFGAFELTLPHAWANKLDQKSDKGNWIGLFFMAATLSIVSFSCTGPIIGTLLVQAASMGEYLGPAIGMLGFSFALAIPFALFAMFPSWLASLPKSGGWLNSVKVVLGFLELALALKFLSNVDLAYHWDWLDREVFLVLWIAIFGLLALYLLGKIKFAHDSQVQYISTPRIFLSVLAIAFTLYMIPGLWGAPLKSISAFLPPQHTQDFDIYTPSLLTPNHNLHFANEGSKTKKYAELFHAPHNLNPFFDYEEGLIHARQTKKPVLIDFTGHACVNCRKMEANIWSDPSILDLLHNEFVIIQLYVDDKTKLDENEVYTSSFSGKKIDTIGKKWSDFQAGVFNSNSQPYYIMMNAKEEILVSPSGANYNVEAYREFLKAGIAAFKNI